MSTPATPVSGTADPAAAPQRAGDARLRRTLGLGSLLVFGLTYLAPVTVFTTYGIVTAMTANHLPASYLVALIAMLFTALSYGVMAVAYPAAGSAYNYTRRTFGPHVGFLTGWTVLLDYLFLPMINFMLIGIYLGTQFPAVPQWVFILAALVLVLVLNVIGIRFVSGVSIAVVLLSLLLVVAFVVLGLMNLEPDAAAHALDPLLPGGDGLGAVFAGAAVLALSFLGFDAVSTLAEEAKEPRRSIPRAIALTTLVGGAIFIAVSWVAALVLPDWESIPDLDSAGVDLMTRVGGAAMVTFFIVIYVVGCFGSGMATQVSVTRILFAMGRDGVLPRYLASVHPRFRTPWLAAITVSAVSLLGVVLTLELVATVISFGALVAFSLVNLSVVRHKLFPGRGAGRAPERGAWAWIRYGVLPLIGFALTVWLWTSLSGTTFVVGIAWLVLGVVLLAVVTRGFRRPPPELDFREPGEAEADSSRPVSPASPASAPLPTD